MNKLGDMKQKYFFSPKGMKKNYSKHHISKYNVLS